MWNRAIFICSVLALAVQSEPSLHSGDSTPVLVNSPVSKPVAPRFSFHGYGTVNYHHFDWDTDPTRRDVVDLERLSIEPSYRMSDNIRVDAEIEFEHGGTGSTMELDKVEESGEYEHEVEKGGEVTLEELAISFLIHPLFNIRVGHFFVPIGFAHTLDEPTDYFTVTRSEAEGSMLPLLWDETGVEINGESRFVNYQLQVINGLDATGFSSGNWIAGGHQGRFETVNAENFAVATRLETTFIPNTLLGVSGYFGNSVDNRPKPDMHVPAYVGIVSAHGQFRNGPLLVRGLGIWGHLSNSDAVTRANHNLSTLLGVKKTAVASEAYAAFVETGVNVLDLLPIESDQALVVFGRVDSYNSMLRTEGAVFDNPYWNRYTLTGGVNYNPHPLLVLKAQYSHRVLDVSSNNNENTFSLGIGLVF